VDCTIELLPDGETERLVGTDKVEVDATGGCTAQKQNDWHARE